MSQEQKHYVIIMPGLGDHDARYKWQTKNWERDFQIIPVVYKAGWAISGKSYKEVLDDLYKLIVKLRGKDHKNMVSIIGASASHSLAFNSLLEFPEDVSSAVGLCGRLKVGKEKGFRSFKARAEGVPAFAESVRRLEASIPNISPELKKRMLITKGLLDELVPEETMTIEGIQSIRIPFVEHGLTIMLSIATTSWLGDLAKGKKVVDFIKTKGH